MENVLFFFADLPVYSYGFMLGVGLILGSVLAQREGKRKGFSGDFIFQFIVQVTIVFVVVGRVAAVFPVYRWRTLLYPWTLFSSTQLDEVRGAIGAVIYTVYFLIRYVDEVASFLDIFTPPLALLQSLAYLGSSVLGRETVGPWGVDLGEFNLQPLPLYGAMCYYFIFSVLWRCRRNLRYDGQLFLGYMTLSAIAQRILMSVREVSGESTNPWLYTLAALLFAFAWLYVYLASPLTDSRRRRTLGDWRAWLFYLASLLGVGLVMVKFFYWRFS
jgi:phosphatidylglycerol:prolipoprotein diacylglycerol transferase